MQVVAQVELDASAVDSTREVEHYIDYSDQLLLKVMTVVKQNNLELLNINNNQALKLAPYGITSIGGGLIISGWGLVSRLVYQRVPKIKSATEKRLDLTFN